MNQVTYPEVKVLTKEKLVSDSIIVTRLLWSFRPVDFAIYDRSLEPSCIHPSILQIELFKKRGVLQLSFWEIGALQKREESKQNCWLDYIEKTVTKIKSCEELQAGSIYLYGEFRLVFERKKGEEFTITAMKLAHEVFDKFGLNLTIPPLFMGYVKQLGLKKATIFGERYIDLSTLQFNKLFPD